MNIGLYQSAASLSSLERWQEAVSQNITSAQTTGFRKRTVQFSTENAGEWRVAGQNRGGEFSQEAVFPKVTTGINFLTGETQATRREMDVAIHGKGFFELQQADGQKIYTRSGEFRVRADRTIVGAGDASVLSEDGSPIVLLPDGGPLTINGDGTLFQNGTQLGRLAVKEPESPETLIPLAGGLFIAPPTVEMRAVDEPELMQGYLEQSNVSSLREMVDLILISRAYEANQRVISTLDKQMEKTLEALG
ncbi:MAG TPA: flagellar hook basal-body protein [Opitutaceae bacterium]|nr:flagellar hook basal-body protein [Opitutaceae bacterium]